MKEILLVLIVTAVTAQQPTCPDGWIMHTDYCYLFSHDKATWAEAESICKALEAYLAEPDSEEIDKQLATTIVQSHKVYWLGGSDIEVEGKWKWMTGERRPFTYTNWIPTDPNNGPANHPEDCLLSNWSGDGKWADGDCNWKEYFVCQMPVVFDTLIG